MKIKANKILAVLCVIAMLMTMIVPMTLTATAAEKTGTISFASTAQRVSQDGNAQVWSNDGIKFTNNKAASTSAVVGNTNPVRLYANSKIVVEAPGNITKIVFDCNSGTYAKALKNSIGEAATVSSDKVTVNFSASENTTFTVAKLTAQVRMDALEVTYTVDDDACAHANQVTQDDAVPATCTEPGKTASVVCEDCGETIKLQTQTPALGHNYVDGICDRCDEAAPKLAGRYYIATIRGTGNYWYMTNSLGTASTSRYQAVDSGLTTLPANIASADADSDKVFVLEEKGDGTFYIYAEGIAGDNKYLGWSSGNSGTLVAKASAKNVTVKIRDDGTFNISFGTRYLSLNNNSGSNYFAWYEGTQKQNLTLIPIVAAECAHTNTEQHPAVEPTCTEVGYTAGTFCLNCKTYIEGHETIPVEHNYGEGIECSECGKIKPDSLLTIEQALAIGEKMNAGVFTTDKYYVTGVIAEVYNAEYGNMKITDGNGNILTIYGTYSADGSTRYDKMATKPVAGDTVTLYGVLGNYNGTIEIKNGWITKFIPTSELNAVNAYMTLAYTYEESAGVLSNSKFVLKCGVDSALTNIEGVTYGIAVSAGDKVVPYTSEATSWSDADDMFSVSIDLGDIINNKTRLTTEFTVRAYVVVDGTTYYSTEEKTYSVASMVKKYYTGDDASVTAQVEHLYTILAGYGLYN